MDSNFCGVSKLVKIIFVCLLWSIASASWAQIEQISIVGTGVGPIPDGISGCGPRGADLEIDFVAPAVAGIEDIQVDLDIEHTWVGDVSATLVAPGGDDHILFSDTGSTTATGCGDSSNLEGVYVFSDTLAATTNWWTAASNGAGTAILPAETYRSTTPGDVATGGGIETVITDSFASSYPAGTWKLLVSDGGAGDTGTVNGATLRIRSDICSPKPCLSGGVPNNGNAGHFFDITAKDKDIIIKRIDFYASSIPGTLIGQAYTKMGSYKGFETDATPWRPRPSRSINFVESGIIERPIGSYDPGNLMVRAGETIGVFLGLEIGILNYRSEASDIVIENSDIALFSGTGAGRGSATTVGEIFEAGGSRTANRSFSGVIFYEFDDTSCYVSVTANGKAFTFCL